MEQGCCLLVYPGGAREAWKRTTDKPYEILWGTLGLKKKQQRMFFLKVLVNRNCFVVVARLVCFFCFDLLRFDLFVLILCSSLSCLYVFNCLLL